MTTGVTQLFIPNESGLRISYYLSFFIEFRDNLYSLKLFLIFWFSNTSLAVCVQTFDTYCALPITIQSDITQWQRAFEFVFQENLWNGKILFNSSEILFDIQSNKGNENILQKNIKWILTLIKIFQNKFCVITTNILLKTEKMD